MPVASVGDLDVFNLLNQQIMILNQKVDSISSGVAPIGEPQPTVENVNYIHQGGNQRNFNNYRPNNGSGNYKGYRSPLNAHPNLSYGNPSNAIQPPLPPGFGASNGATNVPSPSRSSSDVTNELLKSLMKKTDGIMTHSTMRIDKVETAVMEVNTRLGALEHQRSGTSYESPLMPEVEAKEVPEEEIEVQSPNMPSEVQSETIVLPKPEEVKIPFPQVVQKKKLDEKFAKFLEIFKRVHLNIPLIEALQQMPDYLKFLKEIMSKKKKLLDYETVSLTENCSAIIQQKMPAKMKDPGSFNISCVIGNDRQTKALCDLGASINPMPLSFFRKLKFGVLKPTTITLQMADKSIKFPNGVLENVLVRVNDFIFPMDFVVLDMKEDLNVPLILGRPFLATGKSLIDVTKGELTLRHVNKTVILSMLDKMKRHEMEESKRVEEVPLKVEDCKLIQVTHEKAKDDEVEKLLEGIFMVV
ncbi:uncharacterized protein LOC121775307 [Salvia splendens]|uniref:uncharacterized protein LOC121775307 n=1 Tax=Salvia splendens TaxID=180675 RepID=UPI001C277505|nr:uncharacterized protein LOC121775307 [Salvia splendens]